MRLLMKASYRSFTFAAQKDAWTPEGKHARGSDGARWH
jgi:hypothetical protein